MTTGATLGATRMWNCDEDVWAVDDIVESDAVLLVWDDVSDDWRRRNAVEDDERGKGAGANGGGSGGTLGRANR